MRAITAAAGSAAGGAIHASGSGSGAIGQPEDLGGEITTARVQHVVGAQRPHRVLFEIGAVVIGVGYGAFAEYI